MAAANWTSQEQQLLQAALRQNPPSMENTARWIAIAAAVPGRGPQECLLQCRVLAAAVKGASSADEAKARFKLAKQNAEEARVAAVANRSAAVFAHQPAAREPANCRGKSSQPRPAMAVVPSEPSPNEARAACDGLRVMAARLGAQVWALRGTSGARVHCRPPTRRTFEAQNAAARRVLESCAPCAHLRAVVANRPPPALRKLHLRGHSGHRRQLRISEHPTSGHPHKEASGCCGAAVSSSCA